MDLPDLDEVLAAAHVVRLPLHTRFRGVTEREAVLLHGSHGWGEFAPFLEYGDAEASRWLASALEQAWCPPVPVVRDRVPVNATLPAVGPDRVAQVLDRFDGCTSVKVKVAEPGQGLADDVARVAAVRAYLGPAGRIKVDANGAWTVDDAVRALSALARYNLEYAEQPCADLDGLRDVRRALAGAGVDVLVAADESIRKAQDPLRVAVAGAADVVVLKVPPLGGVRAALQVAREVGEGHGLAVVVSSALDTSVGLSGCARLAGALPDLPFACGIGTAALLADDVATPLLPVDGHVAVLPVRPDPARLARLAAPADRRDWWFARITACHRLLRML